MTPMLRTRPASQRGIATILILLLTGLSLTAAVLGTVYYVRGTQEQGVSAHAMTQAQVKAWTGVEVVKTYLTNLDAAGVKTLAAATTSAPLSLTLTGLDGVAAKVVGSDSTTAPTQLTVEVTGTTADGTRAKSTSTVKVVYSVTAGSAGGSQTCGQLPKDALVFNGDVSYTGGNMDIVTSESLLDSVAVSGFLSISHGTKANASVCAKGDISISGGGIGDGAQIYSEGKITTQSMTAPVNVDIWGKEVDLQQGGGKYKSIRAGAFKANVVTVGGAVGTTIVGGMKQVDGKIIPPSAGVIVIKMADASKSEFAVDLAKNVSVSNGVITVTSATRLAGTGELPASFTLVFDSVYGGRIDVVVPSTADLLWGNDIYMKTNNIGMFATLKAFGNVEMYGSKIDLLQGGGNVSVLGNQSDLTVKNSSSIVGESYLVTKQGKNFVSTPTAFANLRTNVSNASPGLPGVPYCDTRVEPINVAGLKSQANYVFYFDASSGDPMLLIQNVKKSSGNELIPTGPYNLKTTDMRTIGGSAFLQCEWQNAHCARNAGTNKNTGWDFTGINAMPVGILWFDGPVMINGVVNSRTLFNGIWAVGQVTLTSSGHGPLYAPNFSTSSAICDGALYPDNLCDKSTIPSKFKKWTDSGGKERTGMPSGNMAILTDDGLKSSGWEVHGNIVLGKAVNFDGALTTVYGSMTVGANQSSTTTIGNGGVKIIRTGVSEDQDYAPGTGCTSTSGSGSGGTKASVMWSRYL
ncbi:hypothetical protein [Jeongeupia naejangsanensis]|uniref:DUF342 domain-containing protein n=1 Tax=Jeongeupia naejangsanensis TaxID=613195 RepID=A0ABS2BP56_9NEIS|nr:hypothetical protein [Jeongeupia naejangsanensis]MBM3117414.1 hypothetical protein [Jeongeupia naejangsanensis]